MMSFCQNMLIGCVALAFYLTTPVNSVECPAYYTYYNVKYYHYCSGVCCDSAVPTACCVWVYKHKPSYSRYSLFSGYSRYSRFSGYSSYYSYSSSPYSDYSGYDTYSDSDGGLSGGAIAGIVIGSLFGLVFLVCIGIGICSSCSSGTTVKPTRHNTVYPRSQIGTVSGNVVQDNPSGPSAESGSVGRQTTRIVRVTLKPTVT